jgi:hypothetical protein
MIRTSLLTVAGLALALMTTATMAAPLAHPGDAVAQAAGSIGIVGQVHGCNRFCTLGPVPRWGGIVRWHRHVGPQCEPVRCR